MTENIFAPGNFTWLLGIEDTCVYPNDPTATPLDEHELTGHSENWRADLEQARRLGAQALRYGVSWPLVHRAPDEFDWTVLDEVIPFAVDDLGLTIVADLVHYGTPTWLTNSFADTEYPAAIEAFAAAFAERYRSRVNHFTPLNEPLTTASFCGLRGVWPPAHTGWDGWVSVAVPMAVGIARSITAIRRVNPEAVIVHVEAATLIDAGDQHLEDHAALLRMLGWLPTDLIVGTVNATHPGYDWLLTHGADPAALDWLVSNAQHPDIIGVNYYPNLTPRQLTVLDGRVSQLSHDRWTDGLRLVLLAFSERYNLPIALTETSIEGNEALRLRWLEESAATVADLIAVGVDIRGYTWWPMFDFIDWSWAADGSNVEEFVVSLAVAGADPIVGPAPPLGDPAAGKTAFLRRMGIIHLAEQTDGSLTRVETTASDSFRRLAQGGDR